MSDARWVEIDASIASAVRHFAGAVSIFARLGQDMPAPDAYVAEMGFMHAMQAGHTSLEAALLRIPRPIRGRGADRRAMACGFERRVSRTVHGRPPVLTGDIAAAANETRQFRNIAARAYDDFNRRRAAPAIEAAALLAADLPATIARFRQAVDP